MKNRRVHLALVLVLVIATIVATVRPGKASIGNVSKSDLAGAWQGTFFGNTGCGVSTEVFDFTLNANGSGTANATSHTSGCSDGTAKGLPITITSLSSNGSGTLNLSCGTGCGFNFSIQVFPDRSTFNLVDVSDPGNYLEGTAIHQ